MSDQSKLAFVDALRGIAAMAVALFHLRALPHLFVPDFVRPLVEVGWSGVPLFFIVSAFTLSRSIELRQGEAGSLRNYFLRRFFRIAPLFYVWLLIMSVWGRGGQPSATLIALNALFGFNFFPGKETGIVPASWTLGVEMVFYVFLPILLCVATTWARSLALLTVTLVIAYFWQLVARHIDSDPASHYHFFSFLHQLPVFVLGVFCYHASRAIQPKHVGLGYVLIACAILGQAAIAVADGRYMTYYLQAAVFVQLLLGLAMTSVPLFVNRATRFLGTISYSLYLNHVITIVLLTPVFHWVYRDVSWSGGFFVSALILFSVLIPLSYLTYRFIEKPGMRMGERIIRTIVAAAQVRRASVAP